MWIKIKDDCTIIWHMIIMRGTDLCSFDSLPRRKHSMQSWAVQSVQSSPQKYLIIIKINLNLFKKNLFFQSIKFYSLNLQTIKFLNFIYSFKYWRITGKSVKLTVHITHMCYKKLSSKYFCLLLCRYLGLV